jgi:hypothetical protein
MWWIQLSYGSTASDPLLSLSSTSAILQQASPWQVSCSPTLSMLAFIYYCALQSTSPNYSSLQ